jgi:hypothetical protein
MRRREKHVGASLGFGNTFLASDAAELKQEALHAGSKLLRGTTFGPDCAAGQWPNSGSCRRFPGVTVVFSVNPPFYSIHYWT